MWTERKYFLGQNRRNFFSPGLPNAIPTNTCSVQNVFANSSPSVSWRSSRGRMFASHLPLVLPSVLWQTPQRWALPSPHWSSESRQELRTHSALARSEPIRLIRRTTACHTPQRAVSGNNSTPPTPQLKIHLCRAGTVPALHHATARSADRLNPKTAAHSVPGPNGCGIFTRTVKHVNCR